MMQFVQQDWLPIVFIGAMLAGIWVVMGATVPGCRAVAVSTSPIAPTNTAPLRTDEHVDRCRDGEPAAAGHAGTARTRFDQPRHQP